MLTDRAVADIRKRDEWGKARENKIGASTAARFAKFESVDSYVRSILMPQWQGGEVADWGHEREPVILADHGYPQNHTMFHAEDNERFLATPDSIILGESRLAQVKTTVKDFRSKRTGDVLIPPHYIRQVWWEQMVMGPEFRETYFIWELHHRDNGVSVPALESQKVIIKRDDDKIAEMIRIANEVLRRLDVSRF